MKRSAAETRDRILDAAYGLFFRRGYGRVSVDDIVRAAGVTKQTLYYHFRSKDELLGAMLERVSELALERFRKREHRYQGSAESMIANLFSDLSEWSATPGWTGAGFTRLAMELADLPGHPARVIARRHKATMGTWWASLLRKAGVASPVQRACELALLMEGTMAMILISGDREYAKTAARAAKYLVRRGAAPKRSPHARTRPSTRSAGPEWKHE